MHSKNLWLHKKRLAKILLFTSCSSQTFPKQVLLKVSRNSRKKKIPEYLFNKVAALQPGSLLKKRPQHRFLFASFVKFLRKSFYRTPPGEYFPKIICRYYTKTIKMTSIEAALVTLMPTLNMHLPVAITLEAAI